MFDILAAVDSRKHEFVVDFGAKAKYVLLGVATLVNRRFGPDISGFVKKSGSKVLISCVFRFWQIAAKLRQNFRNKPTFADNSSKSLSDAEENKKKFFLQ